MGEYVGVIVGLVVGLGETVGFAAVGAGVGPLVGLIVGPLVGLRVDTPVGDLVGLTVGLAVPSPAGCAEGAFVGPSVVGFFVGGRVGDLVFVGEAVGPRSKIYLVTELSVKKQISFRFCVSSEVGLSPGFAPKILTFALSPTQHVSSASGSDKHRHARIVKELLKSKGISSKESRLFSMSPYN